MKRLSYLLTASLCLLTHLLQSQNYQTVMNGDWFDPVVWGGVAAPLSADSVIISHDITFDMKVTLSCTLLKLDSASSLKNPDMMDSLVVNSDEWINSQGEITGGVIVANTAQRLFNTGSIGAATSLILVSFENDGSLGSGGELVFEGVPAAINRGTLQGTNLTWSGTLSNTDPFGFIYVEGLLTTGDSLFNDAIVWTYNWIHNTWSSGDASGSTCVQESFVNTGTITGLQDLCDHTPGGFTDINTGTISSSVTLCEAGLCSMLEVQNSLSTELKVFPSPASEEVHLCFTEMVRGNLSLLSIDGKEFLNTEISGSEVLLNVEGLAPGLYLLKVVSDEGQLVKKLMIE